MNRDILSLLEERMPTFSKGQRRIAAVLTEAYDKAAFMTASALGEKAGVSESTVVRFAAELGFDGYPQMQKAMQDMVLNRLTSAQRLGVASQRMGDRDVVSMVLQADGEKLRQTEQTLDRNSFAQAVESLLVARRIYVIGIRSAAAPAAFLGYYLNYMFDNVHQITTSGASELFEKLVGVTERDAVIAFSFPRYSNSTIKGAAYCRSVGATVIGVTDSQLSPLGQCCDHVLVAKSDMASFVDSLVAPMSVVNALIVALAQRREATLSENLNKLEAVWSEYQVYDKQVDL